MPDDKKKRGGEEQRRFERATVLWAGSLVSGDLVFECVIVNVSVGGAMVRTDGASQCRSPVVLRSTHFGELAGEISWRKGNELGIRFLDDAGTVAGRLGKTFK